MGNNKSLVDLKCFIKFICMRVYPYGVDRVYSELTKVECLFLINTIFFMDGMFNAEHAWWIHLYENGGETASYDNLGRFSGALMNIQAGRMTYLCQPVLYNS